MYTAIVCLVFFALPGIPRHLLDLAGHGFVFGGGLETGAKGRRVANVCAILLKKLGIDDQGAKVTNVEVAVLCSGRDSFLAHQSIPSDATGQHRRAEACCNAIDVGGCLNQLIRKSLLRPGNRQKPASVFAANQRRTVVVQAHCFHKKFGLLKLLVIIVKGDNVVPLLKSDGEIRRKSAIGVVRA